MKKTPNFTFDRNFVSSNVLVELRHQLILGHLPKGAKIIEIQLASEMNVSRGPVRNALLVLEKEGLVRFLSNGRTIAVGFSLADAEKLYDTRKFLETKAVELAYLNERRNTNKLNKIMTEMKTEINNEQRFTQLDMDFHNEILSLSDNKYLIQCWMTLNPLLETILSITNKYYRKNDEWDKSYVLDLHAKITDALIVGDLHLSLTYMRDHLESGRLMIMKQLKTILDEVQFA